MSHPLFIGALACCVASTAVAGTVAVQVEVDGDEVAAPAVEAMVWHALYDRHAHDAVFVTADDAAERMRAEGLGTLYLFEVEWTPLTARVPQRGVVGALAPRVRVQELYRDGDRLVPHASWEAQGALALYEELRPTGPSEVVALPHVALQEALGVAVGPVAEPTWVRVEPTIAVPVVVMADEEYRAFYGPAWKAVADLRVRRASALLAQAGLRLEVVDHLDWASDDDAGGLSDLLDDLAATPRVHPQAFRVGFTQQTELASAWDATVEDVGRAFRPGRDVVVADQAQVPGHATAWDEAEEAAAIAHEILHGLGVPHLEDEHFVMSQRKSSTVHRMAPGTRALARAAASARYDAGDPLGAVASLGAVAEAWLIDREAQLQYVTGNLAAALDEEPNAEHARMVVEVLEAGALFDDDGAGGDVGLEGAVGDGAVQ